MVSSKRASGEVSILRCRGLKIGASLFSGMLAAALSAVAWSAEWSVQPSVGVDVGHDSNPLLVTVPHESTGVTIVTPIMHVLGRTERSNVDLGLVLNYYNYSSDQVEDVNRQILLLDSSTQASERTKLGLDGEFRRDDLRQTVFIGTGGVDQGDADVGLVQTKVERRTQRLRPSWTRALTERSSLGVSYDYRDVTFVNSSGTGLVDFTNQALGVTYSNNFNQRDRLNLTVNVSHYDAPDVNNTTDTTRLLVGVSRAFSETSRGSFSVGSRSSKEDFGGNVNHVSGFVLQANAAERSDVTRLDGTIRHDVYPSGSGLSVGSDQLHMRLVRRVTPKASINLRATLLRNRVLEGSDPGVDRRYYEIEPAFEYQWMPQWFFRVSYAYRYQKFDAATSSAASNAVFFGVAYDWQRQFFGQ